MKILSCSLVLYFICSSVQGNYTTHESNSSDHTTDNFWKLFSRLFFTTTPFASTQTIMTANQTRPRPRFLHAYMPRSNRMYKNKVYRNYAYRRYPTTTLEPTTTKEESKTDYDYKELFEQIVKEAPRVKEALENALGFNITLPPELVDGSVTRIASPYVFRVTLPLLLPKNISNVVTDKPLPNRGFLKLKGGLVNMFKDGDMKVLFREIANQLSQAFNMSSGELRSGSPIMVLTGRLRRRKMSKTITQSTLPPYMATNYKIRVRTRANVTLPQVTDNVINFADFTKYFENY